MNQIILPAKEATIEISDSCNAKCQWCTTGRQNRVCHPETHYMSPELFEQGICRLFELGWIKKSTIIELYNWGEPFLNPHLNDILEIVCKYDLQFRLSTNGSIYKKLSPKCIDHLQYLMVSLPGMTQSSYDKIHQLNLETVHKNIVKFASDLSECDAVDKLWLNFHVYQFNLGEIEEARHFSEQVGCTFKSNIAYFNDYKLFQEFLAKTMSKKDLYEASEQLFLNIYSDSETDESYQCPLWRNLCFDHEFNLIPCCRLTKNEQLGSLFSAKADDLIKAREQYPICRECITSGQIKIIAEKGNPEWYENIFLPELKRGERGKKFLSSILSGDVELRHFGKVYFDCGSGLSEENSVRFLINTDNSIKCRIDLPDSCRSARLDPVEGCGCLVWNLQARCESQVLKVADLNGMALNDVYMFRTTDPQIYFDPLPDGSRWLEIEAEIIGLEQGAWTKLVQEVEEIEQELAENEKDAAEYASALQQAEAEKSSLVQSYEQIIAANLSEYQNNAANMQRALDEAIAQKCAAERDISDLQLELADAVERENAVKRDNSDLQLELADAAERENAVKQDLAHYQEHYHAAIGQRDDYQQQVASWQDSYHIISNSQFWKITKPGRVIMDFIKYLFLKNEWLHLIGKGLHCLRENGLSYTWKKIWGKLGHSADEFEVEIKKGTFPCLGPLSQNSFEKVCHTMIDIIVPVYNGFDYLERLLQTIAQTKVPYRLILIDDKSPDLRVLPLLKEYAQGKENVVLLENETNLGFVKSVNRGLSIAEHHVALVNTDVELPSGWLERLMGPIVSNKRVATTTPFTNCGTICSFPDFCKDNDLFWGMDVNKIDKAFQEHTPEYPIIPTGVGFCMGMSRPAIEKVGVLDAESFGRGYGEENDWCRRAAEAGFVNVHVDNLFVYHKHGGSFESEEKKALIEDHLERLLQKHPNYNRVVAKYCQLDPCAWLRTEVKKSLLQNFHDAQVVAAFNHSWGGGASMYLSRERTKVLNEGREFVQVEYMPEAKLFKIEYFYGDYHEKIHVRGDISKLLEMLPDQITEIWINEMVSYPDLYTALEKISDFAKSKDASLLFLLHDYFALCPTINLLNVEGRYCEIPEEKSCQKCLENNARFREIHCAERQQGIACWRENWHAFFDSCTEIRTFSNSSKKIFCQAYPDIAEELITVRPHSIDYLPQFAAQKKKFSDTLNIAVVGAVDIIKGANIVAQIAKIIEQYGLDIRIIVIGAAHPDFAKSIICIGEYSRNALPTKIIENDIDIVLIPSVWPETFSYTSQEAMTMGLPVACFDIGAPADRVREYEKGIIIPQINAELALQMLIKYGEDHNLKGNVSSRKVLFVVERIDYASRYRVEHFQEELAFAGIASEFLPLKQASRNNLHGFSSIVFYRCSSVIGVSHLSKRAKKLRIRLFFDIDDLIFDADIINAAGLPDEEKKQYTALSMNYCEIIRLCDGVITSTEALAGYLRNSFPDKPVCVRRNSASLELETLSVCAGNVESGKKSEFVYLAYFSGSWTHDKDFELIAEVLVHIFEMYTDVKLRIYGCLHIPESLKSYQGRIELYDFTDDWRTLPEKVAQAHIHLAPLEDTVFNVCKSENKWMEAALAGRPIVASYNEELALVIENGVTGFLCKSQEDWENTLIRLIEKPELRKRIGKNAQEAALSTHLTRNSGEAAVKFIR